MAYDPGALESTLAAAVGDDPALVAELRAVFFESATRHIDAMKRARTGVEWRTNALRLKGLAASFGATRLIDAAELAIGAKQGDETVLRQTTRAVASFGA